MTRGFLNSSIAWWFYVYAHMYYDVKMRDNRFTYDKNKNTSYSSNCQNKLPILETS